MARGLGRRKVELSIHSEAWAKEFRDEAERIASVSGDLVRAIEHVGSTSIPGILAKPIIDICAGVDSLDVAEDMVDAMALIGYDYPREVGIPNERVFGRDRDRRRFLVHVVIRKRRLDELPPISRCVARQHGVGDRLQQRRLAAQYPEDRATYTKLKSNFVEGVLAKFRQ